MALLVTHIGSTMVMVHLPWFDQGLNAMVESTQHTATQVVTTLNWPDDADDAAAPSAKCITNGVVLSCGLEPSSFPMFR